MMKPNCLKFIVMLMLFVVSSPAVYAQQEFIVKGTVVEKEGGLRIGNAQVINQRTKLSVFSGSLGMFQLKAAIGDTVVVIKGEYADANAVVLGPSDLVIYMDRGQMLKEVNIAGQSKKSELNDMKREYRNKGSFYQGKPPFLSFLFTPLTAVYELFGKTPKNARRFGRYYETEMQQTLIDGFFNESLIQSNTDLKDKNLEKFMLDYRPEYEKAKNWTNYDAIKYIKESYKKFRDTLKKE